MKITINEDGACGETEVVITCRKADGEILRMLASLRAYDRKLTGLREGKTFLIDADRVLYFDTADKRTFLYTGTEVYESPLKLYEIEERLAGGGFVRASKSSVVNLRKIASLMPDFGGRLEITMENGERRSISRQYAAVIKEKLGL